VLGWRPGVGGIARRITVGATSSARLISVLQPGGQHNKHSAGSGLRRDFISIDLLVFF